MKKISFSTDKGEFLLVDIPIGIKYVWMSDDFYEKVGYLKNLTEEQVSEVVDSFELFGNINVGYKNYVEEEPVLNTATESLKTLFESKGIQLYEYMCDNYFCENGFIDATYGDKLICSVCENKEEVTYYNPYLFKKI